MLTWYSQLNGYFSIQNLIIVWNIHMVFDLFELFMNQVAILSSRLWRSKCGALSLILWGAHMNIQRITSSYWSYCLLKYAMKCEPQGTIKLDDVNARSLGLVNATFSQLQLISTTITTKHVSPFEATFSCLQIPIISKSVGVKYVDSKPANLHTKWWLNPGYLDFIPLIYIVRDFLTWPNTHLQSIGNNFLHNNKNWRRRHVWAKTD